MDDTFKTITEIGSLLFAINTAVRAIPTKQHDDIQSGFMRLLNILFCHNRTIK